MKFTDKTTVATTQRTITKEGFLVVPATISKVGVFDYLATELGLGEQGIKKVARTEKSLFSDETIKSFENATLTVGHPEEGVSAKNWKQLSVGVVRNVKRVGDELHAEAWVYDEAAIKTVREQGIDQLSCGYDCDILPASVNDADFEMSPMIGNHVAIVAKGRCGGQVKLADEDKSFMSKTVKLIDAFLGAFGIKLSDEQKKQIKEEDDEKPQDKGDKAPSDNKEKPAEPEKKGEAEPKSNPTDKENDVDKAEFEKKLKEKDDEIKRLKDEQTAKEAETQRTTVLADAKANFSGLTLADSASVREIQEQAVISAGIFAKDEAAKLSDAELSGAYQTAKVVAKKLAEKSTSLGTVLLGDSKPTHAGFDFNKMYNS